MEVDIAKHQKTTASSYPLDFPAFHAEVKLSRGARISNNRAATLFLATCREARTERNGAVFDERDRNYGN
jgi:hypothetical protein